MDLVELITLTSIEDELSGYKQFLFLFFLELLDLEIWDEKQQWGEGKFNIIMKILKLFNLRVKEYLVLKDVIKSNTKMEKKTEIYSKNTSQIKYLFL